MTCKIHFKNKAIGNASDTTINASCKPSNINEAEGNLNSSLRNLEAWANDDWFERNAVKSKHMICASKHLYHRNNLNKKSVTLVLGGENISSDDNPRLLGVHGRGVG